MRRPGFTLRSSVLLVALAAGPGCDRNIEPFVPGEEPSPPDLARIFSPEQSSPGRELAEAGPGERTGGRRGAAPVVAADGAAAVSGLIRLADGVQAPARGVLFVIARNSPAGGPPLAVVRAQAPELPYRFELGPRDVMIPNTSFAGPLFLSARLDADGSATTRSPEDVEGAIENPVAPGATGLEIVLGGESPSPAPPASSGAVAATPPSAQTIRGTITLAPGAEARAQGSPTLFIIARRAGAQGGPPTAVVRIASPSFPVDYEIGPRNVMIPNMAFAGTLTITARYDGDGDAMTREPGDLEALAAEAKPGQSGVDLALDSAS